MQVMCRNSSWEAGFAQQQGVGGYRPKKCKRRVKTLVTARAAGSGNHQHRLFLHHSPRFAGAGQAIVQRNGG